MFVNNYISKKLHKLFLIIGFALFVSSIFSPFAYSIKDQIERDAYEQEQNENAAKGLPSFAGPYCFPDKHPQFLSLNVLLAGLIFATLFFSKLFLFSTLFSGFLFTRYIYWFFDTQRLLDSLELSHFEGLDQFFYKSTIWDFITLSFLSILLFWQIWILLRMLIKTLQKENNLP
jgi:hypothetical protein